MSDPSKTTVAQTVVDAAINKSAVANSRKEDVSDGQWVRIETKTFTAGIKFRNDIATQSGPSLLRLLGKSRAAVAAECKIMGWSMQDV